MVTLGIPDLVARVAVQADEVGVEGGHVEAITQDRKAAVDRVAAQGQVLRQRFLVVPDLRASLAVDGVGVVPGRGDVHDAVDDEGRTLEAVQHASLKRPHGDQALDVLLGYLLQGTVTVAVVGSAIHQPVAGVQCRVEQVFFRDRADRAGSLVGRGLVLLVLPGGGLRQEPDAQQGD